MKVPLQVINSSETRATKATIENLVNMYAEIMPKGATSPYVLFQCSGLTEFCNLGNDPILHLHTTSNGTTFAFTKNKIYKINSDKTFVQAATITGELNQFISVADNGIQMCIVDGIRGFVYQLETGVFTEITTQTGFYPSNTVVFHDGYFIFNRAGTGQFFISSLYGTSTDPLDFATAESSPDDTIGLIIFSNQLWLFGQKTIEIWYNSGDNLFPFSRVSGGVLNRGCQATHTIIKGPTTLYFVGDDSIVYGISANSYVPQKLSSYAIEKDITGESLASAYVYTEYGHEFYVLQLPNNNKTWCFDISTGLWHEKRSTVIDETFLTPSQQRHISKCVTDSFDLTLVGSRLNGKILYMDNKSSTDDNQVMHRVVIASPLYNNNEWLKCSSLEVVFDAEIQDNKKPLAMLQWTDDGVYFGDGVQMQMAQLGNANKRFIARRLGRFRQRSFRLTITDNIVVRIISATAEVE